MLWKHKIGQNVVLDLRKPSLSPCYSRCSPAASLVVRNAASWLAADLYISLCLNKAITTHMKNGDLLLSTGGSQPWLSIRITQRAFKNPDTWTTPQGNETGSCGSGIQASVVCKSAQAVSVCSQG